MRHLCATEIKITHSNRVPQFPHGKSTRALDGTGAHRLAAAKQLGWDSIDCIELDDDALKAEMWEISENLHRLDLTKEQRDEHIRRYAELLEAKQQSDRIVAQNGEQLAPRPVGRPKSINQQIADETGLSRETVRRALNPAPPPPPPPPEPEAPPPEPIAAPVAPPPIIVRDSAPVWAALEPHLPPEGEADVWTAMANFISAEWKNPAADLAEIAENLHRREISTVERAELLDQWVKVRAIDQSRQVGGNEASKRKDGKGHRQPSGIEQASRDLAIPATNLRRAVKIAALSPEAKEAAREAGLDSNQAALLEATKAQEPQEQVAAIRTVAERKSKPAPSPQPDIGREIVTILSRCCAPPCKALSPCSATGRNPWRAGPCWNIPQNWGVIRNQHSPRNCIGECGLSTMSRNLSQRQALHAAHVHRPSGWLPR